MPKLELKIIEDAFSIHRFSPGDTIPAVVLDSNFYSISKTDDEISIVCSTSVELQSEAVSAGWQGFKVAGPLDFSLTGILAELSSALADAGISIFAISTYDTDYILVKADKIKAAIKVLQFAGYTILQD